MADDFDVSKIEARGESIFDSVRAKLMFEADVFWTRAYIGETVLNLWLDTYRLSRSFRKWRIRQ
jgi:hypothetical protein